MWYVHKYQVSQQYGGPEEGGWYYKHGTPVDDDDPRKRVIFFHELSARMHSRYMNGVEMERRKREEEYDYSSVLSDRSTFYEYRVSEDPTPAEFPAERPHYE